MEQSHQQVEEFIRNVPKVELHSHLGGSVTAEDAFLLLSNGTPVVYEGINYQRQKVRHVFNTVDDLAKHLRQRTEGLPAYLDRYNATRDVFNKLDNIEPLLRSMVSRYAAEKTVIIEVRTALKAIDHSSGATNLPKYTVDQEVMAYKTAFEKIREEFPGIVINLILCIRRGSTPAHVNAAWRTLEVAKELRKDGIAVAIDLVGAELDNHAKDFEPIFMEAPKHDIYRTMHSGEGVHEGAIKQVVRRHLADRIGHGVALRLDSRTAAHARRFNIPFECCITSNVDCQAYRAVNSVKAQKIMQLEDHPFMAFIDAGMNMTLNCDNISTSHTSLTQEYLKAIALGASPAQVGQTVMNAARASFSPEAMQLDVVRRVEECMEEHGIAA